MGILRKTSQSILHHGKGSTDMIEDMDDSTTKNEYFDQIDDLTFLNAEFVKIGAVPHNQRPLDSAML